MWSPFRARREERQRERDAYLQAITALRDVALRQSDTSSDQLAAVKALAESQKAFFDSFKTPAPAQGWVVRDEDEWAAEQARLQGDFNHQTYTPVGYVPITHGKAEAVTNPSIAYDPSKFPPVPSFDIRSRESMRASGDHQEYDLLEGI